MEAYSPCEVLIRISPGRRRLSTLGWLLGVSLWVLMLFWIWVSSKSRFWRKFWPLIFIIKESICFMNVAAVAVAWLWLLATYIIFIELQTPPWPLWWILWCVLHYVASRQREGYHGVSKFWGFEDIEDLVERFTLGTRCRWWGRWWGVGWRGILVPSMNLRLRWSWDFNFWFLRRLKTTPDFNLWFLRWMKWNVYFYIWFLGWFRWHLYFNFKIARHYWVHSLQNLVSEQRKFEQISVG
jgi:hypothetical protein